ncbi:uncharacterized protein LOC117782749 [Drosophila innubila]|uniref:uncharacterized protein LOC117782749 n=1 Tax=Drosophila innubila TaxID=198719 RepID=UPI00148BD651|nr:uncharacterized protein LOC117782749 [Drosophila innubila]
MEPKVRKLNFVTNQRQAESTLRQEHNELRQEVKEVREAVENLRSDVKIAMLDLAKEIKAELSFLAEKVGSQTKQLTKKDTAMSETQGSTLPLRSDTDLIEVDFKICPDNRQIYVNRMKDLVTQQTELSKYKKCTLRRVDCGLQRRRTELQKLA